MQRVESVSVLGIEGSFHHAMNRQRRNPQGHPLLGGADDARDRVIVTDDIDVNADDVLFAEIGHATSLRRQRSML